jgi:hypothetical protein
VLLLGQDEKEMLDLWAEVLDGGGVAYRDHEPLRLASSRAYGPESGPTLTGSRLTWRATFGGSGQLAAVWAGSPTGTLPLLVTASDASGKIGVTVHPFEQLKASARARACDDPGLAPWVCP